MKRLLTNIFVMLVAIAVTLIALEVGLRLINYENRGGWNFMLFDKEIGAGPGLELTNSPFVWMDEADFDTSKNEHVVIYKQKVPFKKSPGEVRIVSMGDSGTQGSGVQLEESYPVQLQGILKSKGAENVRVVNAGMHMTNTVGQYKVLKHKLLKVQPDIVTLGVYMSNDFNMNLSPENFLGPNSGLFWTLIYQLNRVSVLFRFFYTKLMLVNAMHQVFTETSFDEKSPFRVPGQQQEVHGLNPLDYEEGEVLTYLKQDSPLMEDAYSLFENILTEMKKLGDEHHFQIVVVVIPSLSIVNNRITNPFIPQNEELMRRKGIMPKDLDFSKSTARLKSICEKLDLVFIDPTLALKKTNEPFLQGETHLNGTGYRIVAEEMAECFDLGNFQFGECKSRE